MAPVSEKEQLEIVRLVARFENDTGVQAVAAVTRKVSDVPLARLMRKVLADLDTEVTVPWKLVRPAEDLAVAGPGAAVSAATVKAAATAVEIVRLMVMASVSPARGLVFTGT